MVLALMLSLTLLENRKLIVTIKYYRELSFTMKRKMLPLEIKIVIQGELEEDANRRNNSILSDEERLNSTSTLTQTVKSEFTSTISGQS